MQKVFFLLSTTLLFFVSNHLSAQTSAIAYDYTEVTSKGFIQIQLDNEDLSQDVFFADKVNQLLFIDFEALGEEVQELKIVMENREVYKEDLTPLPDNTIYEIDLKNFEKNNKYKILLKTSFGTLTKEFSIR